jgi:hypothetical protein
MTTRLEIHSDAITQLSEIEKDSPNTQRNSKRLRLEINPQSPS